MDNKTLMSLYDELIISLVVLSLPGERQCEITGFGCVGDEILIDFDTYYTHKKEIYIEHNLLNLNQMHLLDEFAKYLERFNHLEDDFYWDHDQIKRHPLWEELRVRSTALLRELFSVEYDVEITRDNQTLDGYKVEHNLRRLIKLSS